MEVFALSCSLFSKWHYCSRDSISCAWNERTEPCFTFLSPWSLTFLVHYHVSFGNSQGTKILTIKPTTYTNFSNLFFGIKLYMFRTVPPSITGVFHCTHGTPVWHITLLCVQWKTPGDGQRNCLKHVEFYSKSNLCHAGLPTGCKPAVSNLYDIYHCCVYSEKLLMIDRGTVWNM